MGMVVAIAAIFGGMAGATIGLVVGLGLSYFLKSGGVKIGLWGASLFMTAGIVIGGPLGFFGTGYFVWNGMVHHVPQREGD